MEQFVVVDHFVLSLGVKVDLVHRHGVGMEDVHDLTSHGAVCGLFDLGDIQLQGRVDPTEKLSATCGQWCGRPG